MRSAISGQLLSRVLEVSIGSCLLALSTGIGAAAADEQDPMTVVQTYVSALARDAAACCSGICRQRNP